MTDRLKIGQEVLIHGYVDEIRKDTVIVRNEGGYFGTVECEVTDIEMPDTNKVLDKIRAEIADIADADAYGDYQQGFNFGLMRAAQIIGKYEVETEDT